MKGGRRAWAFSPAGPTVTLVLSTLGSIRSKLRCPMNVRHTGFRRLSPEDRMRGLSSVFQC